MSDYFYSFAFNMERTDYGYFWSYFFLLDAIADEENQ